MNLLRQANWDFLKRYAQDDNLETFTEQEHQTSAAVCSRGRNMGCCFQTRGEEH